MNSHMGMSVLDYSPEVSLRRLESPSYSPDIF